jgi:hypothetical protein
MLASMWGMWWRTLHIHCWWECKLVQLLWKSVMRFIKKLKIELKYTPGTTVPGVVPLLGIYLSNISLHIIKILAFPCLWHHYSQ